MLADLRRALAVKVSETVTTLVVDHPPTFFEWPSGHPLVVFVRPASGFLEPWLTFSRQGYGTVRYEVVATVPATDNLSMAELDYAALEDAVDPLSGGGSIFSALIDPDTGAAVALDVASGHVASAAPAVEPIDRPELVRDAEGALLRWEIVVPVQVTVKRS